MQIFANGKQRFYSIMEFYVTQLKIHGVKIWSQCHFNVFLFSSCCTNSAREQPTDTNQELSPAFDIFPIKIWRRCR